MRFIHLSDLHLGKRVNEFSMIEDQKYILAEIIGIIDEIKPEGIFIAGDVYDKSVPSAEAVEIFDDFLFRLTKRKLHVFVISGNHDSPERLAFGGRIMDESGIHISPVYNGNVEPVVLNDRYGEINIYMLPFIKPINVRRFNEGEEINTYTEAVDKAISNMNVDTDKRNILITHQFVTGAARSESEEISVGGSDNVEAEVFKDFDYVALGHIHGPQTIGSERVRYSGTPLKYSFSEASHRKSVTVIDFNEKGNISIDIIPLIPKRNMVELKGSYAKLTDLSFYMGTSYQEDYVHITLTDEEDIADAIGNLRIIYPYLMKLDYDNTRTRKKQLIDAVNDIKNKSELELLCDFYELQNNQPMSEEQIEFVQKLIDEIREGRR